MKKKIFVISSIFIIIDQLIKLFVRKYLTFQVDNFIIPNFFYLTYSKNTGGAFSILENNSIVLAIIGIVFLFGIIYYILKKEELVNLEIIAYSFLIGGIIGNMLDRIIFGYVTDYIGLIFGSYYYPIFNFADIGIVISIIMLIYMEFRSDKNGIRSSKK